MQKERHPVNFWMERVPFTTTTTVSNKRDDFECGQRNGVLYERADSTMSSMTGLKLSRRIEPFDFCT